MIKDNYMIYRKKKNLDKPSRHSLGDFGQEILRFFSNCYYNKGFITQKSIALLPDLMDFLEFKKWQKAQIQDRRDGGKINI